MKAYKILRNLGRLAMVGMFFLAEEYKTENYSLKIRGRPFRNEVRRPFNMWLISGIPYSRNMQRSESLPAFITRIDRFYILKGK